jgi:hypothetical protein
MSSRVRRGKIYPSHVSEVRFRSGLFRRLQQFFA